MLQVACENCEFDEQYRVLGRMRNSMWDFVGEWKVRERIMAIETYQLQTNRLSSAKTEIALLRGNWFSHNIQRKRVYKCENIKTMYFQGQIDLEIRFRVLREIPDDSSQKNLVGVSSGGGGTRPFYIG